MTRPGVESVLQFRGIAQQLAGPRSGALRRRAQPRLPLAGVDLTLGAGELAWVVGAEESIAALRGILAGAEHPTAGSVMLAGRDVTRRRRRQRAKIARELVVLGGVDDPIDGSRLDSVVAARPAVLVCDRAGVVDGAADEVLASLAGASEQGIAVLVLDRGLPAAATSTAGPTGFVAVLCGGRIVETLGAQDVDEPMHPYARRLVVRPGEPVPQLPAALPAGSGGCPWRVACERAQPRCARERPELERPLGASHAVACHFPVIRRSVEAPASSVRPATDRAAATDRTAAAPFADEPTAQEFAEG